MLAMNSLLQDRRPDLVLSGINHGANMGDDVTYSGTVAAAMEGTLLGVRSVALSQRIEEDQPLSFAVPERLAPDLLRRLVAAPWPDNVLLNLNFPSVDPDAAIVERVVRHGRRKLGDDLRERFDPRGRAYFWIGPQRNGEDTGLRYRHRRRRVRRHRHYADLPRPDPLSFNGRVRQCRAVSVASHRRHAEFRHRALTTDARKLRLLMGLRRSGIADTAVLRAIERVPRERFVPDSFQDRAWDDTALPIGQGQTISQPLVVATMDRRPRARRPAQGAGGGDGVRLPDRRAGAARAPGLHDRGRSGICKTRLRVFSMRCASTTSRCDMATAASDGPEQAPFDRIIVTAAADGEPPEPLVNQLAEGGIMICPVRRAADNQLLIKLRRENGKISAEDLMPVRFVPLVTRNRAERYGRGVEL